MLNNYMKRSLMLLGAAALVATANAGAYRDVTAQYITNHNYAGGWKGAITNISEGVGEVYDGAFNLYQVLPDMPAGEYTLTVNAFYRCGTNVISQSVMTGDANHNAYIYINDKKATVKGLFDEGSTPDGMGTANTAFAAGEYLNTVTYTHAGGDLKVGIANTGGFRDEWCCFDNFKLVGPEGDVTDKIVNADFSTAMDANPMNGWECTSNEDKKKYPDVNKGGGVYRKTNASVYNYGQQIELPAGKYRFGMLTFHRYGGDGDHNGEYITCKGQWGYVAGKSPRDWYEENAYDANEKYAHAYLYVGMGDTKLKNLDTAENFGEYDPDRGDVRVRIKDCWELNNGDVNAMPHNEPMSNADATYGSVKNELTHTNGACGWDDSGRERQSAAAFVAEPEKYFQYCEFTLDAPKKVWVGFGKNENTGDQYWMPWADITLLQYDENAAIDEVAADVDDENAPKEYFNLQGMRVAEPANGIFIVKQGSKVSKEVIK